MEKPTAKHIDKIRQEEIREEAFLSSSLISLGSLPTSKSSLSGSLSLVENWGGHHA